MGILYEKVKLSHEAKKQVFISELLCLGVTDYKGKDLNELDYYTLRQVLSTKKASME